MIDITRVCVPGTATIRQGPASAFQQQSNSVKSTLAACFALCSTQAQVLRQQLLQRPLQNICDSRTSSSTLRMFSSSIHSRLYSSSIGGATPLWH